MAKAHFGMIGLGTMGRNFLLNIAQHGIAGVGFDLNEEKRNLLLEEGRGMPLEAAADIPDFLAKLESPRNVMLLVPAGPIVDSVIGDLAQFLDEDDLIIDGGNSHFGDTERREKLLSEKGIGFMGIGVSGGEEGARHGASIMPGGRREHYDRIEKTLRAVAAKVDGEPCVAYMGTGSAGHFVKMVHNGIEYGLMQILAETYDFMRRVLRMDYVQMSKTFADWNSSMLNSYLLEVTVEVLRKQDAETGKPLVEMILDKAAQKGTGKWTSQVAMDLGVPIPTIDGAVAMRQISAQKETRMKMAELLSSPSYKGGVASAFFADDGVVLSPLNIRDAETKNHPVPEAATPQLRKEGSENVTSDRIEGRKAQRTHEDVTTEASEQQKASSDSPATFRADQPLTRSEEVRAEFAGELDEWLEKLKNALISSFIVTYAQGLSLLQVASKEKDFGVDIAEVAKIWRGGCIIRSALLEDMRAAYAQNPDLPNLMLDDRFAKTLADNCPDLHEIVGRFSQSRVPSLCLSSAVAYFEAFRSSRLPANLIQAQRDYFGAHTYQRTDKDGVFHTEDW